MFMEVSVLVCKLCRLIVNGSFSRALPLILCIAVGNRSTDCDMESAERAVKGEAEE